MMHPDHQQLHQLSSFKKIQSVKKDNRYFTNFYVIKKKEAPHLLSTLSEF